METNPATIACRVHEPDTEPMGTIQIRDVPDDVIEALKKQAAALGLSLSQYLRQELIEASQQSSWQEIFDDIEAHHAKYGPPNIDMDAVVADIRERRGEI